MIELYQARDPEPQGTLACKAMAGDKEVIEASPRLSNLRLLAIPQ